MYSFVHMENRQVELLFSENLMIDVDFGINALNTYLSEIALLQAGATFADLGFSERREAQRPLNLNNIAMLRLSGVMRLEDSLSTLGVRSLADYIQAADQDPDIRGILLDVNSGGGEAVAGSYLKDAIESASKPVVVHGHFVGSAAYLAALAADEIILSSEMAKAGSIGAMITINKEMLQAYKERFIDVYATQSKDKNKEFREAMNGDMSFIQKSIDKAADIFQDTVLQYRKIKDKDKALSGSMFYAKEAKALGLVDGIGGIGYAVKRLRSHINYSNELV